MSNGGAAGRRPPDPIESTGRAFSDRMASQRPSWRPVVATAVVVAVVAIGLAGPDGSRKTSRAETPRAIASAASGPTGPVPQSNELAAGRLEMQWGWMRLDAALPAGWARASGGPSIYKTRGYRRHEAPTLTIQDVRRIVPHVCAEEVSLEEVGASPEALVTALMQQTGTWLRGPELTTLGGYPAARLVAQIPFEAACHGAESGRLWSNGPGTGFGVLIGGTGTIYIVNVEGLRLVVTTHERGATDADRAELATIVESIRISLAPPPLLEPDLLAAIEQICTAASERLEAAVVRIEGGQPGSLDDIAGWANAVVHEADDSLAALSALPDRGRDADGVHRRIALLGPAIDTVRAIADAASARDEVLVADLMRRRVAETHRKDQLLGEGFRMCPVALPA